MGVLAGKKVHTSNVGLDRVVVTVETALRA